MEVFYEKKIVGSSDGATTTPQPNPEKSKKSNNIFKKISKKLSDIT